MKPKWQEKKKRGRFSTAKCREVVPLEFYPFEVLKFTAFRKGAISKNFENISEILGSNLVR